MNLSLRWWRAAGYCPAVCAALLLVVFLHASLAFAEDRPNAALEKIRARCLDILAQAATNENAFVRSAAARAAGESADPELKALLQKISADVYPTARLFSLQALEKISPDEARALALRLLGDSDMWVRGAALEMLGRLGGREIIPKLTPHLDADDLPVRLSAAAALVSLGERENLALIEDALKGSRANSRYQAIGYLGKIGNAEALKILQDKLTDPEDEIVYYSLKALGEKAPPGSYSQLLKLVHHRNPSVRAQAILVIGTRTGGKPLKGVEILCADSDPMVRVSAAVAAHRMHSDGCRGVLRAALLKDPDFGVRSTAARVLGEVDIEDRAGLLALAMRDANSRVRTAAVRAAGMMGGPEAFPILHAALDDPLEVVRTYAAGNLLRLLR